MESIEPNYSGEVAKRWRYKDGEGEIGIITSVTRPFCGDCTRARLSADGRLFTCLFAAKGIDVRALLRSGSGDDALTELVSSIWSRRRDRYSEPGPWPHRTSAESRCPISAAERAGDPTFKPQARQSSTDFGC